MNPMANKVMKIETQAKPGHTMNRFEAPCWPRCFAAGIFCADLAFGSCGKRGFRVFRADLFVPFLNHEQSNEQVNDAWEAGEICFGGVLAACACLG